MNIDKTRNKYGLQENELDIISYRNYINFDIYLDLDKIGVATKLIDEILKNYPVQRWSIDDACAIMEYAIEHDNEDAYEYPLFYCLDIDFNENSIGINIVIKIENGECYAVNYNDFGNSSVNGGFSSLSEIEKNLELC